MAGKAKGPTVWHENIELLARALGERGGQLKLEKVPVGPVSSRTFSNHVLPGSCGDCIFCAGACPNLRYNNDRREMEVNPVGCRGCGACLPACPASALQQRNSNLGRLEKEVCDWLGQGIEGIPPSCNYCPVVVGDLPRVGPDGKNVRIICTGRFESALAIEALAKGYSGLIVVGCFFEGFQFEKYKAATERHIGVANELLGMLGLEQVFVKYIPNYMTAPEVMDCLSRSD
jgi:coenzyme F420-reducing hydrogenase delta subunit/Pyruvate/2-oxoacid:ferredoxin oxidoreductase delta subunit